MNSSPRINFDTVETDSLRPQYTKCVGTDPVWDNTEVESTLTYRIPIETQIGSIRIRGTITQQFSIYFGEIQDLIESDQNGDPIYVEGDMNLESSLSTIGFVVDHRIQQLLEKTNHSPTREEVVELFTDLQVSDIEIVKVSEEVTL